MTAPATKRRDFSKARDRHNLTANNSSEHRPLQAVRRAKIEWKTEWKTE
jgi:hypothetical protein